ncbi:hypothetical protein B0H11DRAFT_1911949 [Mycena galericulata]|nr:hypothetical protein B0H11DRAFT_1911949 [Mycena galericulata]
MPNYLAEFSQLSPIILPSVYPPSPASILRGLYAESQREIDPNASIALHVSDIGPDSDSTTSSFRDASANLYVNTALAGTDNTVLQAFITLKSTWVDANKGGAKLKLNEKFELKKGSSRTSSPALVNVTDEEVQIHTMYF